MVLSVQLFVPIGGALLVLAWTKLVAHRWGWRRARVVLVLLLPVAAWQAFMVREVVFGVVPALLDARPSDVRAVLIAPVGPEEKGCRRSLVDRPVRVEERASVEEVVRVLHETEFGDKGRGGGEWCANLGLEYAGGVVFGKVEGAYLQINHHNFVLVERRSMALAPLLARLVREAR